MFVNLSRTTQFVILVALSFCAIHFFFQTNKLILRKLMRMNDCSEAFYTNKMSVTTLLILKKIL